MGNHHDIDVKWTLAELSALAQGRFSYTVSHPTLWRKGDTVLVTTRDRQQVNGLVLDVSHRTRAVLIEMQTSA